VKTMPDLAPPPVGRTRSSRGMGAWMINPVRGMWIGVVTITIVCGVLIFQVSRRPAQPPVTFLGFLQPSPGASVDRSTSVIAVLLKLGGSDGAAFPAGFDAGPISTQVRISQSPDGSSPLGTTNCGSEGVLCRLRVPQGVRVGVPYYLIA
jgi:hypothetical protein